MLLALISSPWWWVGNRDCLFNAGRPERERESRMGAGGGPAVPEQPPLREPGYPPPPPRAGGGREERRRGAPPNAVSGGPGVGPALGRQGGLAAGPSALLLPPSAAAARGAGQGGNAGAAGCGRSSVLGREGWATACLRVVPPGPAVARHPAPASRAFSAQESPGEVRGNCEKQRVGIDREAALRCGGAILQYGRKAVAGAILHLNER